MVFILPAIPPPSAQPAPTATFLASGLHGDHAVVPDLAFSTEDRGIAEELLDRIDARMAEHLLDTSTLDDFEPYEAVRMRLGLA